MLGGLREIGSAVAAATGSGCTVRAVAAVAVLEGVTDGRWGRRCPERGWGRELGGQAVGQEGGRAAQGAGWQVGRQGVAYGCGAHVPFQPGRDTRGEVGRVAGGEQKAGVGPAEVREEVSGLPDERG
jgi:hypothetical protein